MNSSRIDSKWTVLTVICLGILMVAMDEGAVRIILPQLGTEYGARADDVVWVWLIYLLVGAGLVLTLGRLGDAFGRKPIYVAGLALFTVGLSLSAVAPGLAALIGVRAVQAVGAAMALSMGTAILTASFPSEERGRALGILAAVVSVGLLSGPAAGGALLDWLGWRAVFYVRIPLCLVAFLLSIPFLRREVPERKHMGFDVAGALTVFIGLSAGLLAINRGQSLGWTSPYVIGLFALGIAMLVAFISTEKKSVDPVLDLSLFSNRVFGAANAAHSLFYISTIALRFGMPFFLIQSLQLPAATAGLLLALMEGVRGIFSPISGRLSDKVGTWVLVTAGMAIVLLGTLPMLTWKSDASIVGLLPFLVVFGVGMGLFVAPIQSTIMGCTPKAQLGTASAMVATTRQIGSSLGLAIAGMAFIHAKLASEAVLSTQGLAGKAMEVESTLAGFQAVVWVALGFALVGLLVLLLRGKEEKPSSDE
jgi:EmrB/QacA subfamily drug resistance transporter